MEALGAAASVIAVLQLSTKVVDYIKLAKGATQARKDLRDELRACEAILRQLKDEADDSEEGQAWSDTFQALEAPGAPLERLLTALSKIKDKLQHQERFKKGVAMLARPFNAKEIKEILETLEREKSLLQLALENNARILLQEIKRTSKENKQQLAQLVQVMRETSTETQAQLADGFAAVQSSQADLHDGLDGLHRRHDKQERLEERSALLDWLTLEDYGAEQSNHLSRRQVGTGEWLLKSLEFQNWLENKSQTLFCPGIPGAGKTTLTSIVVDELLSRSREDDTMGVAYVYCNFQRQNEQDPRSLLASILRQLAQRLSSLPDGLKALHDKHKKDRTQITYEEISTFLHATATLYSRTFIVIDALDEFQMAGNYHDKFLKSILKLQVECGINLFVTSRHIPNIVDTFQENTTLEISASEHDVRKFLEGNISQLPSFVHRNPELQEEVISDIVKAVKGMFLLAKFHLESLCGKTSAKTLRKTLKSLPTGSLAYTRVYHDAMKRIESQLPDQEDLAKRVLSWITRATRQLRAIELQHALAVEVGETFLDHDNLTQLEDMVSSCAGLVTIDKETDIIRLVHYTTQEYFDNTWEQWFPNAEADITKICCTYLSFETFRSGPCKSYDDYYQRLKENPLFEYAVKSWGFHASKPGISHQEVLKFLQSMQNVEAICEAFFVRPNYRWDGWFPTRVRGLHFAAFFGLEYAVSILLKHGTFVVEDEKRENLLHYSASNGQDHDIKTSLEMGYVDPDAADDHGRTPLAWAATNGHKAVAALLLADERVDADSKDIRGSTPLKLAVINGCHSVAQLLLASRKVDPNLEDAVGETPLLWAAKNGEAVIVKLLLDSGVVNPHTADRNGLTPLAKATKAGHERVVKLLLEASLEDVDLEDDFGIKPLSYAARGGHESIFELLLATGMVDVDSKSIYGRTPLSFAAERGSVSSVQQLLRTGKVDADSKTSRGHEHGQTPLSFAAKAGHYAIVKLLLDTGHVDFDSISTCKEVPGLEGMSRAGPNPDEDAADGLVCKTPLSWAVEAGRETVAQLLLERGANASSTDTFGWTPLLWASDQGHSAIVDRLLAMPGVRADQKALGYQGSRDEGLDPKFTKGRTSLSLAAASGDVATVRVLLSQGLDVNSQDQQGKTPLSLACMKRHEDVICQLIEAGAEANLWDKQNRTPLSYSAAQLHAAAVRLLLGQGARVGSRDTQGRTPLSYTCGGHSELANHLWLKRRIQVDSKDKNGRTPRSYPAFSELLDAAIIDVLSLLIEHGAEVDSVDESGRTPLSYLVANSPTGHAVINFMIQHGAEVNSEDKDGRTPLSYGAARGYGTTNVIDLLLRSGAEVDSRDNCGRTPLSYSAASNHSSTSAIHLLLEHGAEVDSKDKDGRTPLLYAVIERSGIHAVRPLLAKHADVHWKDAKGRTPISVARELKDDSILKLLLEAENGSRSYVK